MANKCIPIAKISINGSESFESSYAKIQKLLRCEGNLAATSVTPLISSVDLADLAG